MDPTPSRRRRCSRCSPTPRPMAARRSSASTPMRPRCFSPASARSRSSARCAFRSSTIRRWRSARPPARRSSRSTGRSRREIYRGVRGDHARGGRQARARRQRRAGRMGGRDAALRRGRRRSTSWRRRAGSTPHSPTRSAARSRPRMPRRRRSRPSRGSRRSPTISTRTTRRCARTPDVVPARTRSTALTDASRAAHARVAPLLRERGRRGLDPPRAWRPASRQHRAHRRPAGAVRRHRVRSADRVGRRALRSRLPADGPASSAGLAPPPTSCSTAISRETRRDEDLDALAALPLFLSMRAAIRAKVTAARLEQRRRTASSAAIAAERAPLFRLRLPRFIAPRAAGAGRGRRAVRHRQVGAGARAGARACAGAGRRRAALRRRAQGAVRQGRARAAAGRGLCARGDARASMPPSSTRRAARSRPAIRRSSMRCSRARANARSSRRPPRSSASTFHGLFLTADLATRLARVGARSRDASDADAAGRARAGALRPRRARLDARRCLRHAGGDACAGAPRDRIVGGQRRRDDSLAIGMPLRAVAHHSDSKGRPSLLAPKTVGKGAPRSS